MEGDDDELKQHKPHINSNFLLLSTKELNGDCSLKKKKTITHSQCLDHLTEVIMNIHDCND